MENEEATFVTYPLLCAYGASYLHLRQEEWELVSTEYDRYVFRKK